MGTNYYRVPSVEEMENRKKELVESINNLDISPYSIISNFRTIEIEKSSSKMSHWEKFTENVKIHLGTRNAGWKFLWNFNNKVFYKDKEQLLNFIRSGRIVDEYGTEIDVEEFIEMSLNWCKENGLDAHTYRRKHPHQYYYDYEEKEYYIDGLRISPHTDFC